MNESPRSQCCWTELCPGPLGAGLPPQPPKGVSGREGERFSMDGQKLGQRAPEYSGRKITGVSRKAAGRIQRPHVSFWPVFCFFGTQRSYPQAQIPSVLWQSRASGEDGTCYPTLPSHTSQVCLYPGGSLVWMSPLNNLFFMLTGRWDIFLSAALSGTEIW